jgi:hypothetical protein
LSSGITLPNGLRETPREQSPGVLFALVKIPDIAGFSMPFVEFARRSECRAFGL